MNRQRQTPISTGEIGYAIGRVIARADRPAAVADAATLPTSFKAVALALAG